MSIRNGKKLVKFWLDVEVAASFKAAARISDGGTSQALARMVGEVVGGKAKAAVAPKGIGQGLEVKVRLNIEERIALALAARQRGTTPANWMRSLALVHLMKRPEWSPSEREGLREISRGLGRIGVNVNQIAAAVNAAALIGECPPGQGEAVARAVQMMRVETRRLGAAVTGNFDYWGLPTDEQPTAKRGAMARQEAKEAREKAKRAGRLRTRKFAQQKGEGEAE